LTRRTALKSGAATAGLLAVGSLSGCSSIPFIGGGAGYTEWVPAPDEFQESESLFVNYSNNSTVAENEDNFDGDYYDSIENDVDALDIDFEDITLDLTISGAIQVYDGDYEEQTVIDALEDEDTGGAEFAEDGEYEGYTVYLNDADSAPDEPQTAYGLNGTTVVQTGTSGDNNAEDVLEIAIDTQTGNGTRFTDDSEDFSTLTDELGGGTSLSASVREEAVEDGTPESGSFEGQIASGSKITVNGEQSDAKFVVVYEDEGDTDQGDLEDYFDESLDDTFSPNGDPSYDTGGRTGVIEFTFDTDELTVDV
jgi:hypothetical protein